MILIDGSHSLHRMLRSPLGELQTKTGLRTGGVHGVLMGMGSVAKKYRLSKGIVVAWDKGTSRYRHEIYPQYKAGRLNFDEITPQELRFVEPSLAEYAGYYIWNRQQLHLSLLPLTGSISIQIPNVEADDIIAWMCHNVPGKKVIVSTDKDLLQLISDDVSYWNPITQVLIDKETLIREWNLVPERYVDHFLLIRAMIGDSSDEIGGVPGIGGVWADRISTAVMKGEPLDESKAKVKAYLENQDIVNRNLRLSDLRLLPDSDKKIIKEHAKRAATLRINPTSQLSLYNKLDGFELRKVKEMIPDIITSNHASDFRDRILRT